MDRLLTINALKFQTLFSVCSQWNVGLQGWNSQNACQNSKQGRPWSDCFFRSCLIWVCSVCLGLFNVPFGFVWPFFLSGSGLGFWGSTTTSTKSLLELLQSSSLLVSFLFFGSFVLCDLLSLRWIKGSVSPEPSKLDVSLGSASPEPSKSDVLSSGLVF